MSKRLSSDEHALKALAKFFENEDQCWPLLSNICFESNDINSLIEFRITLSQKTPTWNQVPILVDSKDGMHCLNRFYLTENSTKKYFVKSVNSMQCLCRQLFNIYELHDIFIQKFSKNDKNSFPYFWILTVYQAMFLLGRLTEFRIPKFNGELLPDGIVVSRLPCSVFKASAETIEVIRSGSWRKTIADRLLTLRGEFCTELQKEGYTYGQIAVEANRYAAENDFLRWPLLNSPQAVAKAIESISKRSGRPVPKRRPRRSKEN